MKRIWSVVILLILSAMTYLPLVAETNMVSGKVTSIDGNGEVGTTFIIDRGASDSLKKGAIGWVGDEESAIAYLKIIHVKSNTAEAVITKAMIRDRVAVGMTAFVRVETEEGGETKVFKDGGKDKKGDAEELEDNAPNALYYIRVYSTKDEKKANKLLKSLKADGYPAYTKEVYGGTIRVGIKWYKTREEALKAMGDLIMDKNYKDYKPELRMGWK